jgi:HEAT repeat protein
LLKPALMTAAKDVRSEVRSVATGALRWYRGDDVVAALNAALDDSSYQVFGSALYGLAKADSAHALPVVKRYLNSTSRQNVVANYALNALSTLDTAQAVTAALEMIRTAKSTSSRFTSLSTIRRYGRGRSDAMAAVKEVLSGKDDSIKSYAAVVLGDIGDASVIPALETVANDKDNPASGPAKQGIEKINKRLKDAK